MALSAVVAIGGRQFLVKENDLIKVNRMQVEVGEVIKLGEVLYVSGFDSSEADQVSRNAVVEAQVLDHCKGPKLLIFKKRRRKNSKRKKGHRQPLTVFKIKNIAVGS